MHTFWTPGNKVEYERRHSFWILRKYSKILYASFSSDAYFFTFYHFSYTEGILSILAIWRSFLNPIGSLASAIETYTPSFAKAWTNEIAGAITCASSVVPEKSNTAHFILDGVYL